MLQRGLGVLPNQAGARRAGDIRTRFPPVGLATTKGRVRLQTLHRWLTKARKSVDFFYTWLAFSRHHKKYPFTYKHLHLWLGFCIDRFLTISKVINVCFKTRIGHMGLRLRGIGLSGCYCLY